MFKIGDIVRFKKILRSDGEELILTYSKKGVITSVIEGDAFNESRYKVRFDNQQTYDHENACLYQEGLMEPDLTYNDIMKDLVK